MNISGISDQYLAMMMQDMSRVPDIPKAEIFKDEDELTETATAAASSVKEAEEVYTPSEKGRSNTYGLYSDMMDLVRAGKSRAAVMEDVAVQQKQRELEDISL